MAKRPECLFQIVPTLGEVRPSIGVDGDNRCAFEGGGGLDRVVRVHGEIELAPRLRRSPEEQHKTRFKSPLHFGHALVFCFVMMTLSTMVGDPIVAAFWLGAMSVAPIIAVLGGWIIGDMSMKGAEPGCPACP